MTLNDIKDLSNRDLLELFADKVRIDHYDPYETPKFAKELYEAGITQDHIFNIVLKRMRNDS